MKKIIIFFLLFQNLFSQDNLPNFSVKLLNNQSSNLVSLTNEISLISFWATWCLPCIKEIDKINTFVKDYDNLSVILINTDKAGEIAKVKRFVKTKRYPLDNNYHIIMDYNQKLSRSFNAQPIPLTLITKNNQIIFRKRGFNVGDEIEIKNIIEQEIAE